MTKILSFKITFAILGIVILSMLIAGLVSADENHPVCPRGSNPAYILSTTLDSRSSEYAIPNPWPYIWPLEPNAPLAFPSNVTEAGLVNSFNLPAGTYLIKITNGAFSRWANDSKDTTGIRGGGLGLAWETTANLVYNNNGLYRVRFGDEFFSTASEAENAGTGAGQVFNHTGGKIYLFIEDTPLFDNRGNVTLNLYKCQPKSVKENCSHCSSIGYRQVEDYDTIFYEEMLANKGLTARTIVIDNNDVHLNDSNATKETTANFDAWRKLMIWLLIALIVLTILILIVALIKRKKK